MFVIIQGAQKCYDRWNLQKKQVFGFTQTICDLNSKHCFFVCMKKFVCDNEMHNRRQRKHCSAQTHNQGKNTTFLYDLCFSFGFQSPERRAKIHDSSNKDNRLPESNEPAQKEKITLATKIGCTASIFCLHAARIESRTFLCISSLNDQFQYF